MKRIITLALSILMIVTSFTFMLPVSAQNNGILITFNYQDKCNGVVDGKKTATTEKVTIDGVKALKIVPSAATAQSSEIRLDCYSLSYPAEQLKGVKYVTVKYRYDGTKIPTEPMRLLFLTGGGAFSKSLDLKAVNSIVGGKWDVATFDVSALNERLVFEDGKIFKQFHLWPYGAGSTPTGYDGQAMYISDITFYNTTPSGVDLPEIVDKPAAVTPSTPAAPSTDTSAADVNFVIDYPTKNKGIVDNKMTADTEKVTIDGISALKITPTPDSAQSNEIRIDGFGMNIDSNKIKGTKYITVKYRYDGGEGTTKPMTICVLASGGALEKAMYIKSVEAATSGGWKIAVFDASEFGSLIVADQKLNHFHFWPYGQGVDPKGLTSSDVMYIGDITFSSKLPEGVQLPTTTEPTKPSAPSTPTTPDKPLEGALEGDENGFLLSFSYQEKCNGVVEGKKTAKTEKVEFEGQKAVKITPTPDTALTSQLTLDSYSFYATPDQLVNAKYMSFKYKYVAPEGAALNPMGIRILGNANRLLTKGIDTNSLKPIVNGEWAEAVFNVSQFGDFINKENKSLMLQFHLYPYGKKAAVSGLTENHVMYISDVSFYTMNPDPNTPYTISFKKGHPDIEGEDPAPLTHKRGEKFTLPEMPYEIGDATFKGWRSSENDKFYMPGDEYTVPDNNVVFSAEFDMNKTLHDFLALPFIQYQNGSCEGRDNLKITNEVLQGKDVVKVVPNPTASTVKNAAIVDGWSYGPAGVDLGTYKYLVITYYYDGAVPKDFYLFANIMKRKILTKAYGVKSTEPVTAGRWNFAVIDFSGIDEAFVPGLSVYNLEQMHIYPFNGASVADFKGDEALYINNLMFFKEKPDLKIYESYMKGYDGGLFMPEGNMTRAEACTIVARLAAGADDLVPTDKTTAFTDVPANQWYHKYISYVESLGYLKGYTGNFLPNQAITRAEFVELVYNMGLLKDAGKNGVFTDVAADHPRAAVIAAAGKAGLVNGYDNGDGTFCFKPDNTITRAEVVKVVNNAYGRSITKKQLSEEVRYSFNDLPQDHWAYADIMEATLAHVSDNKGWIFCMVSPYTIFGKNNDNLDYAAGENFVKELDAKSEAKKQEILNTPNMDLSKITGTKYYISNNGDDNNDGKSPATAWKTIGRMKKEADIKAGDAVLFERGGLWRERFNTKSGVTYTAYGEGKKPVLYGSPENGAGADNWTLLEGTTNIWVYKNELLDVGGIICDNGKAIGLKVLADLYDGKYYVRDTKKAKEFVITEALNEDLEFFSYVPTASALATQKGKLYFRCDAGNPGALYSQIEFNIKGNVISNGSATNVTIDNLCIMYTGTHGIGSGTTKNLTVTNCEIGWIGGTLQHYKDGRAGRLGNGVEIYGGCDGYLVDNNYIWQCYDAGATHQYSSGGITNISMYNATYSNNLIEDCIYNIEYFTGYADDESTVRDGKNFVIKDNILRRAGYGWGNQRPDGNTSAHIKSWSHRNEYEKGTYIIENNIFDRGSWNLLQTTASYASWCPIYKNNTYIQVIDGGLAHHAALQLKYDCFAEESIKYELKDEGAKVYFLPTSYKHTGFLSR